MHSSTSSEGSRSVRIVVPCAQTRVATETHSRANDAKHRMFQEACPAGHRAQAKREARSVLCHSLMIDWMLMSSSSCSWPAVRGCGLHQDSIGSKFGATFICAWALYWLHWQSTMVMLATFSHDCDITWLWHQTFLCNYMKYCDCRWYSCPLHWWANPQAHSRGLLECWSGVNYELMTLISNSLRYQIGKHLWMQLIGRERLFHMHTQTVQKVQVYKSSLANDVYIIILYRYSTFTYYSNADTMP